MAVRFISMREKKDGISGATLIEVLRDIDQPDGTVVRNCWTFPPEVLSIRAGEYGLDPETDFALAWELVHGESLHGLDGQDDDEDPPLFTAPSLAAARMKHTDRMRNRLKRHESREDRRTGSRALEAFNTHNAVLHQVHKALIIDHELAGLAGAYVESIRGQQPAAPPTLKERYRHALGEAPSTPSHAQRPRRIK
jgi:hypothetical protein